MPAAAWCAVALGARGRSAVRRASATARWLSGSTGAAVLGMLRATQVGCADAAAHERSSAGAGRLLPGLACSGAWPLATDSHGRWSGCSPGCGLAELVRVGCAADDQTAPAGEAARRLMKQLRLWASVGAGAIAGRRTCAVGVMPAQVATAAFAARPRSVAASPSTPAEPSAQHCQVPLFARPPAASGCGLSRALRGSLHADAAALNWASSTVSHQISAAGRRRLQPQQRSKMAGRSCLAVLLLGAAAQLAAGFYLPGVAPQVGPAGSCSRQQLAGCTALAGSSSSASVDRRRCSNRRCAAAGLGQHTAFPSARA